MKKERDEVLQAFEMLGHVYENYNNEKSTLSNKYHLSHPDRVEHDLSEREKEHLSILRSKLHMEMLEKINKTLLEASNSSDRLGNKVWWLNVVMALLSCVLAVAAVMELLQ